MRLAHPDSTIAPSSNVWGVPDIDPALQPSSLVAPLVAWGSVARTKSHGGTWHFYVDDRRFALDKLAAQVARTAPAACVEPNVSIFDWTPRAEALAAIYQKRRIAWQWQREGIPVFVDLCVPPHVYDLALLGVPKGWRAYATRAVTAQMGELEAEYALAAEHAGAVPLFLIVGGGRKAHEFAARLPGAIVMPDHMAAQRESGQWAKAADEGAEPERA